MTDASTATGHDMASSPNVAHVAVKIPPFWNANPAVWFSQVECQFHLAGITSQTTRYFHVAAVLPPEVASEVTDILCAPLSAAPYDRLKAALIERTTASERKRLQQLLSAEDLGDRRPSQLLRHMQSLLGTRAATFDEALLKELFLQRLPPTIQMLLATATNLPITELAVHADKIMEVAVPTVATVQTHDASALPSQRQTNRSSLEDLRAEVRQMSSLLASVLPRQDPARDFSLSTSRSRRRSGSPRPPQRSRSRSQENPTDFCWYHWSFGASARNCQPPCSWPGNRPGGR